MVHLHESAPQPAMQPACDDPKLAALADKLWPSTLDYAEHNRAEWLRKVWLVRRTSKGWLADAKERLQ